MTEESQPHPFPTASEDIETTLKPASTAQTRSPSYRLAYADNDFLLTDDLRSVRLMLEFLKPELAMQAHGIKSTVVIFGSTRIRQPAADRISGGRLQSFQEDFYGMARELGSLLSAEQNEAGQLECVVMTGGGPGIMEAANRGAADAGAKSIGLNIVLPREQLPNEFMTPELAFQFHYFALRKMHFLLRAKALVAFPGGFGTLDELFEALTLLQTKRIKPMPVLLFGESFWRRIIDFQGLVEAGVISAEDLELFRFVQTPEEAVRLIRESGGSG